MTTSSDMTTCPNCGHRNPSWAATCDKCGTHLSLTQSDSSQKHKMAQSEVRSSSPQKLPTIAHILSGWPLILVFFGGAIGGALGGVAYGINIALYKSKLPGALKFVLNLLVGMTAIGVWYMISAMLIK